MFNKEFIENLCDFKFNEKLDIVDYFSNKNLKNRKRYKVFGWYLLNSDIDYNEFNIIKKELQKENINLSDKQKYKLYFYLAEFNRYIFEEKNFILKDDKNNDELLLEFNSLNYLFINDLIIYLHKRSITDIIDVDIYAYDSNKIDKNLLLLNNII